MATKIKLALICFLLVTFYYGASATQRIHTQSSNPLQFTDPGIKSIHLENGISITIPQSDQRFPVSAMKMEDDAVAPAAIAKVKKVASAVPCDAAEEESRPGSKKKSSTP